MSRQAKIIAAMTLKSHISTRPLCQPVSRQYRVITPANVPATTDRITNKINAELSGAVSKI